MEVELIIFGFLVSLTLKATLDTAYGRSISAATSFESLLNVVLSPVSFQVFILLLTLIRFVYGAYRVSETTGGMDLEKWVLPWIIPTLLVLFVLFYIGGLCVLNPVPFYASLIVLHAWDFLAFLLPMVFSDKLTRPLRNVIRSFIVIDLLTVASLALAIRFISSTSALCITAAACMVALATIDFVWNRKFYFFSAAFDKA
jgi:hypothetical protein